MLIVSVERNRQIRQRPDRTHAQAVLPSAVSARARKVLSGGGQFVDHLWKSYVVHDEDGNAQGTRREKVGRVTVLRVDDGFVADVGLDAAVACGHKTVVGFQSAWSASHPRSPEVSIVWFVLGDWRDRDLYLNWTGRAGGDYCVDEETEALTKRGWLKYDEIRDDDELLGYDIEAHATRWESHDGIYVFPAKTREMIVIRGRSGTILSTPNHRWPVSVERRNSPPRTCASCGEPIDPMGYPKHEKACRRNVLIAERYEALRLQHRYHDPTYRIVAEEFDVSQQIVRRSVHRRRGSRPTWPRPLRHVTGREERTTETLGSALLLNGAPCSTLPDDSIHSDAFVELVAWWCTEGSQKCYRNGQLRKRIGISQSIKANPKYVDAIERALNAFAPGHWRYGASPNGREEMKIFLLDQEASSPILEVAPGKVMKFDFILSLTRAQLELLWRVWIQGDGTFPRDGKTGGEKVGQRFKASLEPLQMALCLLGSGSTLRYSDPTPVTYDRTRLTHGEWGLRRLRRNVIDQATPRHEILIYEGPIWCPSTPSTYWLARRDGRVFLTGNTRNPGRAMDADAPVLTREEIDALSVANRQKDEARRAKASLALATESYTQRLVRLRMVADSMGEEARRAIRQEVRIIEQRSLRAEAKVRKLPSGGPDRRADVHPRRFSS